MKKAILIGCLILAWHWGSAQQQVSLLQAQEYALQNSYAVQEAQLNLQQAEQVVKETTAIGLPQINAEGTFQNFLDIPVQVIPDFISPSVYGVLLQENLIPPSSVPEFGTVPAQFGTDYNVSGEITASQLLFNGSYILGLQASKAYKELSQVSLERSEHEIKNTIIEAYHLCLAADENLTIVSDTKEVLEKTLNETKLLYENGFVEQQDVEQLEFSMASLENQIRFATNQKTVSLQMLKFHMGMPQETEITLSDTIDGLVSTALSNDLSALQLDIQKNQNYRLAMSNKTLMELDVKNKKAAYLPSLNAFFSYQRNAQRNEFNFFSPNEEWFPSTVWGLNLSIPIFSSGMRKSQVQQSKLELEKADLMLKQAEQAAKLELSTARTNFSFATANLETAKQSQDLAKRIFDKTQIKFNEGIASSFELTTAKNQMIQAQSEYVSAVVNLLNSTNALNKALNIY